MEEFIQLLSQHDKLEREQFSELTIAANALKKELVSNYIAKIKYIQLKPNAS